MDGRGGRASSTRRIKHATERLSTFNHVLHDQPPYDRKDEEADNVDSRDGQRHVLDRRVDGGDEEICGRHRSTQRHDGRSNVLKRTSFEQVVEQLTACHSNVFNPALACIPVEHGTR